MSELTQNISQLDSSTRRKLKFVKTVELGAFIISIIYFAFYWGYAFFGDTDNLGLAGLALILILPGTLVTLIWRFLVWRAMRKVSTRSKVFLWIDALGPALTVVPVFSFIFSIFSTSIGLAYPLSILDYLQIPNFDIFIRVSSIALGIVCLVFGLSAIDKLQKIQAGEPTTSVVDIEKKRKVLRNRILLGVTCGLVFILGVFVWWLHFNRQQGFDDPDHDGVLSLEEERFQTSKTNPDTDGDGLDDCTELGFDRYNDQFPLAERFGYSRFETDPLKADTDGDGSNDGEEAAKFSNPVGTGLATQEQITKWDTWSGRPECATMSSREEELVKQNKLTLPTNRSDFPFANRNINVNVPGNINTPVLSEGPQIKVSDIKIMVDQDTATVSWKTDVPTGGIFYYGTSSNTEHIVRVNGYSHTNISLSFPITPGSIYKYIIDPCVQKADGNPTCAPQPEGTFRAE